MEHLLTFVLLSLLVRDSLGVLRISADPVKVEIGVTRQLDLQCSYPAKVTPHDPSVISMFISKSNSSHEAHFAELLSITAPDITHDLIALGQHNATFAGHVNDHSGSFIYVTWMNPGQDVLGLYRCDVYLMDDLGHPSQLSGFVLVSVESPDMDLFADRVRELLESLEKIQSKI
ncbi:hypothetical protein Btru_066819 [Bulinus truncatus]|nr:hypothetical protein Btru_066819 [Bulinus truncatus]